ncbi:autotransporter domain-containing protein [Candidatus Pelagibacter sp.]|uniref:autotransporter domain-containing protein n=1 Tax=Candidatus Pelagibacter sp. TaxID=2024849 RepID=UPI003F827153
MKKTFLFILFFLILFTSKSFPDLQFKQSLDISDDTDHLRGIFIKPDGTKLYVTSDTASDQSVFEYSLTTPFDISTAVGPIETQLTIQEGGSSEIMDNPHAIEFKPDGTKMFVIRSDGTEDNTVAIEQFNLSTPWDSTTITWSGRTDLQTGCTTSIQARGLDFKPDGTRVFIGNEGNDIIAQYDLTTPWDVTSMTNQFCSPSISGDETKMRNIQLSSDGNFLYVGGNTGDDINKYSLTTPYNITSISLETSYSISAQTGEMRGFIFSSNFTKLYVTGDDGSSSGDNVIYEYDINCVGTIACLDASTNTDVKAIIEANVESAKRIIRNNTLPIFHRTEWLRRHKNKDNLSNFNTEINFTNEKIARLVSALKTFKKEKDRTYSSDDWFQWSEGRVSIGERNAIDSSSRDIHTYGISIGADRIKNKDRDTMYGYVFQYGNDNIDIGGQGTKLDTDSYSLALYGTKIGEDDFFTDAIIGLSLLDTAHTRITHGNILEGDREGQQIFGSINFGKRLHNEKLNISPGIKLDLGYTKLREFREKTTLGNSLADALIYKDQNIKTALATIGLLFDTENQQDEKTTNHHGRLEYVGDFSPSSDAEFYYLNNQSTVYNHKANKKSKHNYRVGYGIDITSITGWSVVTSFERFGARGKGFYNELYLMIGYVPIDDMKLTFEIDNLNATSLGFANKINKYNFEINSNFDLLSDEKNHHTKILVSNNF